MYLELTLERLKNITDAALDARAAGGVAWLEVKDGAPILVIEAPTAQEVRDLDSVTS